MLTEKQDGRRVKLADGQTENYGASTPVLYPPWLYRALRAEVLLGTQNITLALLFLYL